MIILVFAAFEWNCYYLQMHVLFAHACLRMFHIIKMIAWQQREQRSHYFHHFQGQFYLCS